LHISAIKISKKGFSDAKKTLPVFRLEHFPEGENLRRPSTGNVFSQIFKLGGDPVGR
jgi:hypothetical protein